MTRVGARVAAVAVVLVALLLAAVGAVAWLNLRGESALDAAVPAPTGSPADVVARGEYLARAGNCRGCHTLRGGAPYAGGRGIETPFGTVYAPNLTPDPATGIGAWSAAEFWRALHNGRSRDGRLLYPAFPYPNYSRVTRADADAIYAYLRSLAPVVQPNRAHALDFPFDHQAALAVWRALFFRPAGVDPDPARGAAWNRGAYLVEGLGHCSACHASRNVLGAASSTLDLAGGLIPVQNWYAPSLADPREAGVADWRADDVVALLGSGVATPHGRVVSVAGPMAEVVAGSTQYLTEPDLRAIAAYLQALEPPPPPPEAADSAASAPPRRPPPVDTVGAKLYDDHCARCHGDAGEGAPGIYPALAGNRAVLLPTPANLAHLVLEGGFAPATAGHPRPFGMPPFATELGDADIAHLLTFIRNSWGNRAAPVTAFEVERIRGAR